VPGAAGRTVIERKRSHAPPHPCVAAPILQCRFLPFWGDSDDDRRLRVPGEGCAENEPKWTPGASRAGGVARVRVSNEPDEFTPVLLGQGRGCVSQMSRVSALSCA
jgi:hypothetical protein